MLNEFFINNLKDMFKIYKDPYWQSSYRSSSFYWYTCYIKQPISQFPEIAPTTVNIFVRTQVSSASFSQFYFNPYKLLLMVCKECVTYFGCYKCRFGNDSDILNLGTDPDQTVVRVKTRVDQVIPLLPNWLA
jgi:hypothetical protein